MSRLDRHVAMVQNKLALGRFVHALAWAAVFYAGAVWIGVLVDRFIHVRPPHLAWFMWGGVGACALAAIVWALMRRPTAHDAAVAIDEKLALKEKFSTALYARPMKDPFAQAAVKDAERTAENVSLHKRFPLEFPRQSLGAVGIGILVAVTLGIFTDRVYLFGKTESTPAAKVQQAKIDDAKKAVERALQVVVDAQAKGVADEDAIKQAKQELENLKAQPIRDPDKTKRSAARALSDLDQALKQQIASNQKIADAENESKAFKSLMPASDEKGPVADAQRKIAKGDFADAVDEISKAVDKFDKMSDEEKKKAAEQMAKMAQQLNQLAQGNQQQQQQMQQQLQQAGLNQQQAQQAQQLMNQAAQGDKQAQQQLQQMGQQAMKQMNNGQGPNPQQQQALNNMMKQMQAQANAQQQAQQMAQAAQQMAQAMKQQQQQQQQQANQGGQKGGQNAQQQAQQQQMAQAAQQMQQQLGAMQAMKADAQQLAAAQQAAAQGAAQAAGACNNPGNAGQQGNQGQGQWQGNGPQGQGQNQKFNGPKNGMAGGGIGAGDRTFKQEAPYAVKQEISTSEDIEGGKILASTLIKAKTIKGQSSVKESAVAAPPEQEATDEVEQDRISKPAQQAVKEYFSAWQKDAATK